MKHFSRKQAQSRSQRPHLAVTLGIAGSIGCIVALSGPALADGMLDEFSEYEAIDNRQSAVSVPIDNSTMLELERNATTIVVGNPAIAEVSVQKGNLLFILGRNFGTTNVIALDSDNKEIANIPVSVTTVIPHHMTVHRGAAQVSYSCAPRCERSLIPGDFNQEYANVESQVRSKLSIGKDASGQR